MKTGTLAIGVVLAFAAAVAPTPAWQPAPPHRQMPIWPGTAPDPQQVGGSETVATSAKSVGGKSWSYIMNVTEPTITVYSPAEKNTGTAVIVFPGGGYQILAIDLEGTEVCDWLVSKGITCVLLKYRVTNAGKFPKSGAYPDSPMALEDAQRAVGLVRFHAVEWHIDPHKIGVLGFSAGGHLVAAVSTHFDKRLHPAVDAADKQSCRPDFALALYPGHMLEHTLGEFEVNPYTPFTGQTPPTFIVQAGDDPVDSVRNSLVYYIALQRAGVPAEMHLYPHGGHAFGLRRTNQPITEWPELAEHWLRTIRMVP